MVAIVEKRERETELETVARVKGMRATESGAITG